VQFLAIGAFAGLRHAEIERLDWREVRLADRFIEVTAGKSKTASRRLVPITDNLAKWLAPHAEKAGRVPGRRAGGLAACGGGAAGGGGGLASGGGGVRVPL